MSNSELDKEIQEELNKVLEHLINNSIDLDPEFAKIIDENFWELLLD